jgi:hypothetical protein
MLFCMHNLRWYEHCNIYELMRFKSEIFHFHFKNKIPIIRLFDKKKILNVKIYKLNIKCNL